MAPEHGRGGAHHEKETHDRVRISAINGSLQPRFRVRTCQQTAGRVRRTATPTRARSSTLDPVRPSSSPAPSRTTSTEPARARLPSRRARAPGAVEAPSRAAEQLRSPPSPSPGRGEARAARSTRRRARARRRGADQRPARRWRPPGSPGASKLRAPTSGRVRAPGEDHLVRQPEGRRREDDHHPEPGRRLRGVRSRRARDRPRPAGQPDDEPGDRPRQGRGEHVRRARRPHPDPRGDHPSARSTSPSPRSTSPGPRSR